MTTNLDSRNGSKVVFLGGLPLGSTQEELLCLLRQFDNVIWLDLPREKKTGALKGYARAEVATQEGMRDLLAAKTLHLRGSHIGIKKWADESQYLKEKDKTTRKKLFVRFHPSHSVNDLRDHFRTFGDIETVDVKVRLTTNAPRNFGYIIFKDADSATYAASVPLQWCRGKEVHCTLATPYYIMKKEKNMKSHQNDKTSAGMHRRPFVTSSSTNDVKDEQLMASYEELNKNYEPRGLDTNDYSPNGFHFNRASLSSRNRLPPSCRSNHLSDKQGEQINPKKNAHREPPSIEYVGDSSSKQQLRLSNRLHGRKMPLPRTSISSRLADPNSPVLHRDRPPTTCLAIPPDTDHSIKPTSMKYSGHSRIEVSKNQIFAYNMKFRVLAGGIPSARNLLINRSSEL